MARYAHWKKYKEWLLNCTVCDKEFYALSRSAKYCELCKERASLENKARAKKAFREKRKVTDFRIFERDGFRCAYCGKTSYEDGVKLHVDHVYPRSLGGKNHGFNLVTSCRRCNLAKNNLPLTTEVNLKVWETIQHRNERLPYSYKELKKEFDKKWRLEENVNSESDENEPKQKR